MDVTFCIGRVGALAVALGIGTAIASSAGTCTATAAPDTTSTAPQHNDPQSPAATKPTTAPASQSSSDDDKSGTSGRGRNHIRNPRTGSAHPNTTGAGTPSAGRSPSSRKPPSVQTTAAPTTSRSVSARVQPTLGALGASSPQPKAIPAQAPSASPSGATAAATAVHVQLDSTGIKTPTAQVPTTASITTSSGPLSNGNAPSTPLGSPIAWTIAAWVRRAASQLETTTTSQTPTAATAPTIASPTAAQTTTTDLAPASATLLSALKPVTAVKPARSTLVAGTPTIGTPDATTGAVSGSLNVINRSTGTITYTVSSQPNYGTVTVDSNGTFTYTPTQLARDLSAVSANANTSSFTVMSSSGSSKVSQTVTVPVLATPITGDSTAVLQDVFSNLKAGSTLTLASKTFYHSGVLQITVSGLTINGNGATLQATNDATSAVEVLADHVTMSNLTLGANLTGPRYYANEQHKLLIEGNYDSISNVTINGAAGAGVYVLGAGWFNLTGITVNNSRADGISMTGGAHDGVVNNPVTNNTGDDGVSVVSYVADGTICSNITINNPIVNGTTWGRGVTVVGGQNITYNNIKVSNTNGAGVYVASEPSYNTIGVSNIIINGGSVTGANYNSGVVHGAILVYAGNAGQPATGVTIENLSVAGTALTAQREIGLIRETGSSMSGIILKNISFDNTALPILYTNTPSGSYSASGITKGGTPVIV